MASLALLRKKAKDMGVAAAVIRGASTPEELESIIADHSGGGSTKAKSKVAKKKSATKAVAKKATGNSKSGRAKSKPAAKSQTRGKAKRTASGTNGYVPKGGRNLLDGVDYTHDEGWNPRDGSPPARIIAALRKAKGNREKAYDALSGDVWDFVGKKTAAGEKRSKGNAEKMLRYRIARTAWDFAMRTGQHNKATNRVEYGTGGTGQGTFKPARKSGTKTKASSKTKTAARGRKAGSKKASSKRKTASKR